MPRSLAELTVHSRGENRVVARRLARARVEGLVERGARSSSRCCDCRATRQRPPPAQSRVAGCGFDRGDWRNVVRDGVRRAARVSRITLVLGRERVSCRLSSGWSSRWRRLAHSRPRAEPAGPSACPFDKKEYLAGGLCFRRRRTRWPSEVMACPATEAFALAAENGRGGHRRRRHARDLDARGEFGRVTRRDRWLSPRASGPRGRRTQTNVKLRMAAAVGRDRRGADEGFTLAVAGRIGRATAEKLDRERLVGHARQ